MRSSIRYAPTEECGKNSSGASGIIAASLSVEGIIHPLIKLSGVKRGTNAKFLGADEFMPADGRPA
jgi:hypothetical protein